MFKFSLDALNIDPAAESERIADFIRKTVVGRMHKKGGVVGLSGGIDSAVSAALAVKAFGPEKVLGILLPEKDSKPESEHYARLHAELLGIGTIKVDITATVDAFGSYRNRDQVVSKLFPDFDSSTWSYKIVLPQDLLEKESLNIFSLVIQPPNCREQKKRLSPQDFLQIIASTNIRQRARMIYLYYFAEKNNYAVIGTTNRTEARQGYFVKYGDGGVDIEPLAHLYKTQVYSLGEHLDVPGEIIKRAPGPDTYTAAVSDTEFYFGIPFHILDPFLWADEHKIPPEDICEALSLTAEQYRRIKKNIEQKSAATWHFLQTPPTIE